MARSRALPEDWGDVGEEKLGRLVRNLVQPELIEYLRRFEENSARASDASCSAQFNYLLGVTEGIARARQELQRLLSEALNPEFKE